MATIIRNIELFNNQSNANDLQNALEQYIENYGIGHVAADRSAADDWFRANFGEDVTTHWADRQDAHFTLNDDTAVSVTIEEVSMDGNTDDYCYIVTVTEE